MKKVLLLFVCMWLYIGAFAQNAATCGFTHKKIITIQGAQITGGPHTNFPVLIDHTDATNLTTAAGKVTSPNGFDIAFADDSGNLLAFELEQYNGTTGQVTAWVNIPTLTNGTDVTIHMLYGKNTITTDQSSTGTWNTNFQAVMHLGEAGNGTTDEFKDATANGFDGTGGGLPGAGVAAGTPAQAAGRIGFGQDFNDAGTQDHIRLQTVPDDTWTGVTVSAWIFAHDNGDDRIFGKSWGIGMSDNTWLLRKNIPANQQIGSRMQTNTNSSGDFDPFSYNINTWYLATLTWDAATNTQAVYVNGVLSGAQTLNGTTVFPSAVTDNPTIGNTTTLNRGFDGIIDEARVSDVARSADWIATTFTSQNTPEGTFYTISTEVNNTFASTVTGDWDLTATWGGTTQVPGVGANVTINDIVRINSGSDDYTICSCLITDASGSASALVLEDGRFLTIIEDVDVTATNFNEVDLFLADNNTRLDILGDLSIINNSLGALPDSEYEMNNGSILNLTGDLLLQSNSGDFSIFEVNGTADANITGNVILDQNGGDDIFFEADESSNIDVGGNFSILQDGGDDVFLNLNTSFSTTDAELRIAGNLIIDANGGDDIFISLFETNSLFEVSGDFNVDNDSFDEDRIDVGVFGGDFNVLGNTSLIRRNSANEMLFSMFGGDFATGNLTFQNLGNLGEGHELRWFVNGGSTARVNGNFTIDQDAGDDYEIQIDNAGTNNSRLEVTGNFVVDQDGGDDGLLVLTSSNSAFTVGGNVDFNINNAAATNFLIDLNNGNFTTTGTTTITRTGSSHQVFFDMDGGNYTTSGLTLNNQGTAGTDHDILVTADQASIFRVNGNTAINTTGGNDVQLLVNQNAGTGAQIDLNGTLTVDQDAGNNINFSAMGANSIFDVSGNFSLMHDGGNEFNIETAGTNAQFNIGGTSTVNWTAGVNTEFEIAGTAGTITFTGAVAMTRSTNTGPLLFDLDGANLNFNAGSTFLSQGDLGNAGAVNFRVDAGSIFTNTGNFGVTMSGGDDFNVQVDVDGAGTTSRFVVTQDLTVNRSNGDDIDFQSDDNNSVIDIGGNFAVTTSGGENFDIDLNNQGTLNVGRSLTINHTGGTRGLIDFTGAPNLNITNDFTILVSAGGDDYEIDLNAGLMDVGGNFTLSQTTGSDELHLNMDGGSLDVGGDFLASLSGTATTGEILVDLDNGSSVDIVGNMTADIRGGNDLEIHLEQNNVAGTSILNVDGNLILDHNGATGGDDIQFIVNDNAEVHVDGFYEMNTTGSGAGGNFFTQLDDNALLDIDGNFNVVSAAQNRLEIRANNNSKIELAGNFVRASSPNDFGRLLMAGTSTIEYNGSANTQVFAQDAGGGTDAFVYQNVIINNTFATSPQVTMEGRATVNGNITFTDGIVRSTAANVLVLVDGSDALTESDDSHVDGPVEKVGNDAFDFPVGDDGQLQAISISAPAIITDVFTAQYLEVDPNPTFSDASIAPTLNRVSSCEYWTLDRTNGTSNVQVTINYDVNSCGITDISELRLAGWDGMVWQDLGGVGVGSTANGTVQSGAVVTTFIPNSPFTLASTSAVNALPIELLAFDAQANGDQVDLTWVTATETNNEFFTVERSRDLQNWEDVLMVPGAGNSVTQLSYKDVDPDPYTGISYYRLRQTDFDGMFSISNAVAVEFTGNEGTEVLIYPNPVASASNINLELRGFNDQEIRIEMIDLAGKVIQAENIQVVDEQLQKQLVPETALATGIYFINVVTQEQVISQKLIVR